MLGGFPLLLNYLVEELQLLLGLVQAALLDLAHDLAEHRGHVLLIKSRCMLVRSVGPTVVTHHLLLVAEF